MPGTQWYHFGERYTGLWAIKLNPWLKWTRFDMETYCWKFITDDWAVREHFKLLEKKFRKRQSEEVRASWINPPKETEVDKGLRDIIESFGDSFLKFQNEKLQKENHKRSERSWRFTKYVSWDVFNDQLTLK